jgi:hypothetical protein
MGTRPVAPARGFWCAAGWKDLVLTQDPRRHIGSAGRDGGELESPAGKLLEGNATGRHLFDGAGDLFHRGSEVAIGHLDDRLTGLLHAFEDLLVFDFEFGVVLSFFAYDLAEGVVLARVGILSSLLVL